ncbi:hypothetical protein, partial [Rhizomicrobium electricum]
GGVKVNGARTATSQDRQAGKDALSVEFFHKIRHNATFPHPDALGFSTAQTARYLNSSDHSGRGRVFHFAICRLHHRSSSVGNAQWHARVRL